MNDAKRGIIIFQFYVSVRDHNLVKPWLKPDICWLLDLLSFVRMEKPLHNYKTSVRRGEEEVSACCGPCADVRCDLPVLVTCEWCNGDAGLPSPDISVVAAGGRRYHPVCPGCASQQTGAANEGSRSFHSARRRPLQLLGSSPCWQRLLALSQLLRICYDTILNGQLSRN